MPDALAPDPFTAMAAQLNPKRAVSYIRVSTREQAQRGGSEEGFSLPAQREANKRKAQSMGALVVKEFAWTAGGFSDSACFVLQAAFFRSRKSLSASFGVRYPRAE